MTRYTRIALALFAGLALTATVGVLSAQGTSKAPAPCGAGGPGTLYDDPEVRVFEREVNDDEVRTVACSHITGHRTKLAQDSEDSVTERVENLTAPGRWLGYSVLEGNKGGVNTGRACVVRIRDGRTRCKSGLTVLALGATRAGSFAWLAYNSYDGDTLTCCAVYEKERGAEVKQLDSGPDIDKGSFAVGGHRIYWVNGGEVKSATMP